MLSNSHERDIELASFLVRAKPRIIIAVTTTILIVELLSLAFIVLFWGRYWVSRGQIQARFSQFPGAVTAVTAVREFDAAKPLNILGTTILSGSEGMQDAMAIIENPNTSWVATVRIAATTSQTENGLMQSDEMQIMPKETRVVGIYGAPISAFVHPPISSLRWQRIDPHEVPHVDAFVKEHTQFEISAPLYINASSAVSTDRIQFVIKNASSYSYFEIGLDVVMYVGDSVIGVEHTTVAELKSGMSKDVEIHSVPRGVAPTETLIFPHVDLFDRGNYMKVES